MASIEVQYRVDAIVEATDMRKRMFILGQLIIQAMRQKALSMGLKRTGDYSGGFFATIQGSDTLLIENRVDYAEELEFGTFSYFDRFGVNEFPSSPDPKKKDMSPEQRKRFLKGAQPFAVMRRILFNKVLMQRLINRAFS